MRRDGMRCLVLVLFALVLLAGCISARLDAWRSRADAHQAAVQAYDRDADRFLADYRAVSDHPAFARTTEKFRALYARLSVESGAEPRGRLIDATVSSMDADEVKISTRLSSSAASTNS
jgi:outer membrane murein-binding lipoprotein Lpp